MTVKVSTLAVRQRLGGMLNRISESHDEFIIERKGQAIAALVPVEKLEQMREMARRHAAVFLELQSRRESAESRRKRAGRLDDEKTMALALAAQRWARKQTRKSARRSK